MNKYLSKKLSKLGNIKNIIKGSENNSDIYSENYEEFNETIKQRYLLKQQFFCQNKIIFNNTLIEEKIKLYRVNFSNISFNMFLYKNKDTVSISIYKFGFWEFHETNSIISALSYYSKKQNIAKKNIFFFDIGANIGWFSLVLGKFGYNILSFEPSKSNYYILLKNFCLNEEINMIIINKGLDNISKKSRIYHPLDNIGNARIIYETKKIYPKKYEKEEIILSKLNNYITYFKSKYLALIKLDVEGSEGKVIEGGIDLIIKYHVPFIFMEWSPRLLKERGTDPRNLLELFERNGYKISKNDFLSKQYCSIEQILNYTLLNIYIIYNEFL